MLGDQSPAARRREGQGLPLRLPHTRALSLGRGLETLDLDCRPPPPGGGRGAGADGFGSGRPAVPRRGIGSQNSSNRGAAGAREPPCLRVPCFPLSRARSSGLTTEGWVPASDSGLGTAWALSWSSQLHHHHLQSPPPPISGGLPASPLPLGSGRKGLVSPRHPSASPSPLPSQNPDQPLAAWGGS